MTSFVEGRAIRRRGRKMFITLAVLVGALALSACAIPQPAIPQANLEATVEAMVDAKLTETVVKAAEPAQVDAGTTEPQEADEEATASSGAPLLITPTPDRSGELSAYLVANTRHFKGDPDAPVTIIEFSDFQ